MGKGNVDDPERDPALFPESRVRPWVVDEEAEIKMKGMLDNLEKTLTFVSPVKDALGLSSLDRTLLSDNRGDIFFKELAAMEAEEKEKNAQGGSRACMLQPVSEVFEDMYREAHGLPPRQSNNTTAVDTRGDGHACLDACQVPNTEAAAPAVAVATATEGGLSWDEEDEQGQLASDPEVGRLLEELQAELDDDSIGDSNTEGGDDDVGKEGEGDMNDEESDDNRGCRHSEAMGGDISKAEDGSQAPSPARGKQPKSGGDGEVKVIERSGLSCGNENRQSRQEEGGIDISRMKIDAPLHHHPHQQRGGVGVRPRSAPSACLSAGGFSRLSSRTSSSSHFARTVSRKLLQVTQEVEEQRALLEANGRGAAGETAAVQRRSGTPASEIVQADGRISTVKQNAEALQASMSVKRTSYLHPRQSRSTRKSSASPAALRQRPKTAAAASSRRHPPERRRFASRKNESNSMLNSDEPLLSRQEKRFLFGPGVAAGVAGHGEKVSHSAPSLRQTTLGRVLLNSSSSPIVSNGAGRGSPGNRKPPAELLESRSTCSFHRRPLSAGSSTSSGTDRTRRRRTVRGLGKRYNCRITGSCFSKQALTCHGIGKVAMAATPRARSRSFSATLASERRGVPGPSFSAAAAADDLPASQPVGRCNPESPAGRYPSDASDSQEMTYVGGLNNAAVRSRPSTKRGEDYGGVAGFAHDGGLGRLSERGVSAKGGAGRQPGMNVRQALEATIRAAIDAASPLDQFVNARKTISEMKRINTKDSTGDLLLSTQGMSKARIAEECWSSETGRQYR